MAFADKFPNLAKKRFAHSALDSATTIANKREEARKDLEARAVKATREALSDVDRMKGILNAETWEAIENPLDEEIEVWVGGCIRWSISPRWSGRVPASVAQLVRNKVERLRQWHTIQRIGLWYPGQSDAGLLTTETFSTNLQAVGNAELDPARRKRLY